MTDKITKYQVFKAVAELARRISVATHSITEISFLVLRIQTEKVIMGESYLLAFQYSPQAILGAMKDAAVMGALKEIILASWENACPAYFEKT